MEEERIPTAITKLEIPASSAKTEGSGPYGLLLTSTHHALWGLIVMAEQRKEKETEEIHVTLEVRPRPHPSDTFYS